MKNLQAIILLFLANTVSGIAQGLSMLAIPWYFARTNDMELFGLIYVVVNIASFFWVPFSGTLVDRFDRKHLFLALTAICGLLILGIAVYGEVQGGLHWILVAAVFMITFLNFNVHYPSLYAFLQEISERERYGKISSYIEIQGQVTNMIAGAFGAMLLEGSHDSMVILPFDFEAWTIYEIFLLDGATYFIAFLIILAIRYVPLVERPPEAGSLLTRLKTGWEYLVEHKTIFIFGVGTYSVFVSLLTAVFYLNATYVSNHLLEGGDVFAISETFYAFGAILAGITIRWIFRNVNIPTSIIVLSAFAGILFAILAITKSIIVFFFVLLLLGIANAGVRIQRVSWLFQHVPNRVYGRTGSIFFLTNIVFRTGFLLLFSLSFFNTGNNIIYAFAILSLFIILSTAVLLRFYPNFVRQKPFY